MSGSSDGSVHPPFCWLKSYPSPVLSSVHMSIKGLELLIAMVVPLPDGESLDRSICHILLGIPSLVTFFC